jgi:hypothetical protein
VPKLGGEETDVGVATRLVPDERATHYWDGAGYTMAAFRNVLGISEDVWDVYLLYGPDARWDGAVPPLPDFWMHQLGSRNNPRVEGPWLDTDELAGRASALLNVR